MSAAEITALATPISAVLVALIAAWVRTATGGSSPASAPVRDPPAKRSSAARAKR